MAEKEKPKTYVAAVGMNLGCSPKDPGGQRIEAGEAIPLGLGFKPDEIKDLLAQGAIIEKIKEAE